MAFIDDAAVFTAYIGDAIDHAFGGSSTFASGLEVQADPALAAINAAGGQGAADVNADVAASEQQTIAELPADAGAAAAGLLKKLPIWLPWVGAGLGVLAVVGIASYAYRAIK